MACAALHPELPGVACILAASQRGHPWHVAMRYTEGRSQPEQVRWADEGYRSPQDAREQSRQAKVTIDIGADQVRAQIAAQDRAHPPVLKAGQRKRTRLGQVANLLATNVGQWVDGHRLETVEIGGSSGLRRVRELRDDYGWHIIQRPVPGSTDQYQLVELPGEFRNNDTEHETSRQD